MGYSFVVTKEAAEDLRKLDRSVAGRIVQKIHWLARHANPLVQAKPLKEPASGDVRFRVGDYRLIAVVNKKQGRIEIVKIGHRGDIYR